MDDQSYLSGLENSYLSVLISGVLQAYYTSYICFAFPLDEKLVACGKRKNGVIRGERGGLTTEEDFEQCSEAGVGACAEWAGPRPDNRLCAAVQGSRKLVTVTHGDRVLLWGSQCVY